MSKVSDSLWSAILDNLQVGHPELVRGWFSTLRPVQITGGVLEVCAANDAQCRYLAENCLAAFAEAAQAASGRFITLSVCVADPAPASPETDPAGEPALHGDYVFEDFVTGPSNRLAHAAAVAVADDPGQTYNPLFVHGAAGLGKTHLLEAIFRTVRAEYPNVRCCYISCESFVGQFIEAVETGSPHQFRERFRYVDALLIDDVQFLTGRERSQEELFHTFNALCQSQRQIVLTADCPPGEIPGLEERLVTRFSSGLVAELAHPCTETRMAIVRQRAQRQCIEIPEEVVELVCTRVETSVGDLLEVLARLDARSVAEGIPITPAMAEEALGGGLAEPVRIPVILEAVASRFDVRVSDLQGKKRSKAITHPRHVSMYLARQLTSKSLEDIGGYFGGRDHSTVLHANRAIAKLVESDPGFRNLLDEIASEVKNATY